MIWSLHMRPRLAGLAAALAAALLFPSAAPAADLARFVELHGNRALVSEVYLAVLRLPREPVADAATARKVQKQLQRFLRKAGYELAVVNVSVARDHLIAEVNEGRVQKVLFLGGGSLTALRLRLAFNLPNYVFNRPLVERQLARLKKKYELGDIRYRLVQVDVPDDHQGPQLGEFGEVLGQGIIVPSARYELHIYVEPGNWGRGVGVDLDYDYPDGLAGAVDYKGFGLLLPDDRWKVAALLGGRLRRELETDDPYAALSRAGLEAQWHMPSLAGQWFRPWFWARSNLLSRQRSDLDLEVYWSQRLDGGMALGFDVADGCKLSVGGGAEQRYIFWVDQLAGSPAPAPELSQYRPYALAKADLVFDPEELRLDRRAHLVVEGRQYWTRDGVEDMGRTVLRYRNTYGFGWHDLLIAAAGAHLWGNVLFDDDESIGGTFLRGVFGDTYYVKDAGALSLEFRYSVARDVVKVSVFHDAAVFGDQDRELDATDLRVANSFGLGFNALLLDIFQLNIYYSAGFSSDGTFDYGTAASLEKVY